MALSQFAGVVRLCLREISPAGGSRIRLNFCTFVLIGSVVPLPLDKVERNQDEYEECVTKDDPHGVGRGVAYALLCGSKYRVGRKGESDV